MDWQYFQTMSGLLQPTPGPPVSVYEQATPQVLAYQQAQARQIPIGGNGLATLRPGGPGGPPTGTPTPVLPAGPSPVVPSPFVPTAVPRPGVMARELNGQAVNGYARPTTLLGTASTVAGLAMQIYNISTGEATPSDYQQLAQTAQGILQGPGVPEPIEGTYWKTWHTKYERRDGRDGLVYFWALNDGRIVCWNNLTERSKIWRPKKPIAVVMQGSKMQLRHFLKLERIVDRVTRRLAKQSSRIKLQTGSKGKKFEQLKVIPTDHTHG